MKPNISLEQPNYDKQHIIINQDSILKETLGGTKDTTSRILNSSYVGLIKKENSIIGFLMLVYDYKNNVHQLDMGIISKYRNQGYGTTALNQLNHIINKDPIDINIQIKKDNLPAIKAVLKNGFILTKQDNKYHYYENVKIKQRNTKL